MTRVLFCVMPEKGHINPYIGPAQALQAAGVEVAFHASADISTQLAAAGITMFLGDRTLPSETHRGAAFAERIRDAAWLRACIRTMLVDAARPAIEPLRAVMRQWRPDVVAIDPMVYAAAIAAEREGLPWAALSNSLNPALPPAPAELDSELLRTVRVLAPERDALFAEHGMAPAFRGCDVLSPHLTIAFTTEALVGRVPGVELVGPSLPRTTRGDEVAFPWGRLDPARPLVYVSFGSQIYHQPRLFRCAFDAVADLDVQLVASASDLATSIDGGELGAVPSNVIAWPYVPQLALLDRARAFITHGGANSVMEAIAHDVPLALLPLCNDQFHNAHFVERAGIGRVLDAEQCTRDELRAAITALVGDGPERQRMADVSASYARDGAAESARLLIALASGSHPARAS